MDMNGIRVKEPLITISKLRIPPFATGENDTSEEPKRRFIMQRYSL